MYAALLLVSRRFPARAGIDRAWRSVPSPDPGFPRTRGDRPCMAFRAEPRPRVPPHARG